MGTSYPKPRIGASACLLGELLRYDGGRLSNAFLTQTLAPHVEWTPVCPESEVGMGTPREPVRLVDEGSEGALRMRGAPSGVDHTDAMRSWASRRVEELARLGLHGYVLTKDSPSCGLFRVKVYPSTGGSAARTGRGLFAGALAQPFPLLPVEEQGRLNDPRLRGNSSSACSSTSGGRCCWACLAIPPRWSLFTRRTNSRSWRMRRRSTARPGASPPARAVPPGTKQLTRTGVC